MSKRKILTYDEEIDKYLCGIVCNLQMAGIKRPSKADAIRFIIKQNEEANIRFKRKAKS